MRNRPIPCLLFLLLIFLALPIASAEGEGSAMLRVGLYYAGSTKTPSMPTANLKNSVGTGYRMGYFDEDLGFSPLAATNETQISVLKTQNIYILPDLTYSNQMPASPRGVVGCYHIQLPGEYPDFSSVSAAAAETEGGFAAWIEGTYYLRAGAYETAEAAQTALVALGNPDARIVGTSAYAVSVTVTQTATILFQFDGGQGMQLAIRPGLEDGETRAVTWFKGYQYCGSFRYERIGGGDLTVVNILPLEDYIRGILPYEMSNSWPLEALKAQAVSARTYAAGHLNKHKTQRFDICATDDCQVYRGVGSANAHTDRAVDETLGQHIWYDGKLAETYYYSCNGGGSEDAKNVWVADIPYLKGVIDPYEPTVAARTGHYGWTYSFTKARLAEVLRERGYNCGEIVDFYVSAVTPTGNVATITFVDSAGKPYSFSKDRIRTMLNIKSIRFSIEGIAGGYSINGQRRLDSVEGLYAIGADGAVTPIASHPYVLMGDGKIAALSPEVATDTYVLTGSGWGHQVGMSQWGAYAMAQLGKSYLDILQFYYTGIEVY